MAVYLGDFYRAVSLCLGYCGQQVNEDTVKKIVQAASATDIETAASAAASYAKLSATWLSAGEAKKSLMQGVFALQVNVQGEKYWCISAGAGPSRDSIWMYGTNGDQVVVTLEEIERLDVQAAVRFNRGAALGSRLSAERRGYDADDRPVKLTEWRDLGAFSPMEFLRHWRLFFMWSGILSVVLAFLAPVPSIFSMQIYERVVPARSMATLGALSTMFAFAIACELVMRSIRASFLRRAGSKSDLALRKSWIQMLLDIKLRGRGTSPAVLHSETRDFEQLREGFSRMVLLLGDMPAAVGFVIVLFFLHWSLGLMTLVVMIGLSFYGLLMMRRQQLVQTEVSKAHADREKNLYETLHNLGLVKLFGQHAEVLNRDAEATERYHTWSVMSRAYTDRVSVALAMVSPLVMLVTLSLGSYLLSLDPSPLTQGTLVAASILSGRAAGSISALVGSIPSITTALVAMRGVRRFVNLESEDPAAGIVPAVVDRVENAIEFRMVSHRYHDNPVHVTLRELSLTIAAGEALGITGHNGSGKTTILKLLQGFERPSAGMIGVDANDLINVDMRLWRKRIAVVPQRIEYFSGRIRDVIAAGDRTADDEVIKMALRACGPAGEAMVKGFGLDYMLDATGSQNISGGQLQVIGIARALLRVTTGRSVDFLLLDEPTMYLDQESAMAVKASLRYVRAGLPLVPGEEAIARYQREPDLLIPVSGKPGLIIVTHDLAFMHGLVDRVIGLELGRIKHEWTAEQFAADVASVAAQRVRPPALVH